MTEAERLARQLRRLYPRMRYLSEAVFCSYCEAQVGEPCVTRSGMTSTPHTDRIHDFEFPQR